MKPAHALNPAEQKHTGQLRKDSQAGAWLALAFVILSTLGLFAGVFQIASAAR